MKPTHEKRTTTQPGLGKVGPARRSTLGAVGAPDPSFDPSPISAPPPSGGPPSARMTRPLEQAVLSDRPQPSRAASSPPSSRPESQARTPSEKPVASERAPRVAGGADPRSEGEPSPSGRIERVERVSTERRVNRMSSKPPSSKAPTSKAPSKPPREVERRSSTGGFSAVEVATGRRPISGTVGAPVAVAVAGPARSKRVSIREDNLGRSVNNVADAVGASGRVVPKLLKSKAEIAAAPIDHRAGFLLAHIDGVTTVAGLVDICGMPEEEVQQILERLRRLGIVAVR